MKGQIHPIAQTEMERAILIGVKMQETESRWQRSFAELHNLADTAGVTVVGELIQARTAPDSTFFIGKGKCEELQRMVDTLEADVIIANQDLTPVQVKHLERITDVKVIDRTQLILHIFADRARSREGKLQVELAQLKYLLPRLLGKGIDMSRLGGGIGAKGPGETKLELDRRRIRDQIHRLEVELKKIQQHRTFRTGRRGKGDVHTIALVGYTNAGKSTLFHRLVQQYGDGETVIGQNRLFDTLDTTTRKLTLPLLGNVVLSDTVGFIQDLPHHLVQSFRSTLEEVVEADLLLHVVDASDQDWPNQVETVYGVLHELHTQQQKVITVFNKMDLTEDGEQAFFDPKADLNEYISAETGMGIQDLLDTLVTVVAGAIQEYTLEIPYQYSEWIAKIHSQGYVLEENHLDNFAQLRVKLAATHAQQFQRFMLERT